MNIIIALCQHLNNENKHEDLKSFIQRMSYNEYYFIQKIDITEPLPKETTVMLRFKTKERAELYMVLKVKEYYYCSDHPGKLFINCELIEVDNCDDKFILKILDENWSNNPYNIPVF